MRAAIMRASSPVATQPKYSNAIPPSASSTRRKIAGELSTEGTRRAEVGEEEEVFMRGL